MKHREEKKNSNIVVFVVLALIVGFFSGYILAVERATPQEEMDMDMHEHATNMPHTHEDHMHELYEFQGEAPPTINIRVLEDPKSGWNLFLDVENFEFNPAAASTEHVEGEGHSHLYINGEKITRLYSNWFFIPELEPGEHEIKVDLTTNDHKTYAVGGVAIEDVEVVVVS